MIPDADSVQISSEIIEQTAGEWSSFTLELYASNGKLYHHSETGGWYLDMQNQIKLNVPEYKVQKG